MDIHGDNITLMKLQLNEYYYFLWKLSKILATLAMCYFCLAFLRGDLRVLNIQESNTIGPKEKYVGKFDKKK